MKNLCLFIVAGALLSGCGTERMKAHNQAAAPAARDARVIDVRTTEEFASGHVKGAINVPVDQLQEKIAQVEPNKNAPLMVHCQSGGRSARATRILKDLGYQNVKDLGSFENARRVTEGSHMGSSE